MKQQEVTEYWNPLRAFLGPLVLMLIVPLAILAIPLYYAVSLLEWLIGVVTALTVRPSNQETSNEFPKSAAFLLLCFLPKKDREPVLGDLKEEFPEICAEFGTRRAKLWFWAQTIRSLWPLLSSAVGKLAKWSAAVSGLRLLGDFLGRFIR